VVVLVVEDCQTVGGAWTEHFGDAKESHGGHEIMESLRSVSTNVASIGRSGLFDWTATARVPETCGNVGGK
jgi:hypothetical protein